MKSVWLNYIDTEYKCEQCNCWIKSNMLICRIFTEENFSKSAWTLRFKLLCQYFPLTVLSSHIGSYYPDRTHTICTWCYSTGQCDTLIALNKLLSNPCRDIDILLPWTVREESYQLLLDVLYFTFSRDSGEADRRNTTKQKNGGLQLSKYIKWISVQATNGPLTTLSPPHQIPQNISACVQALLHLIQISLVTLCVYADITLLIE